MPLSFQWQFNGNNLADNGHITGSQTNALSITNVQMTDAGNYQVIVTNSYGSITSSVAVLRFILRQPSRTNRRVWLRRSWSNANFSVGVSGTAPLFYQWQFNGTNIARPPTASYTIANAQSNNQGNYSVVVTNAGGSVTSSNATLTVLALPAITNQPANKIMNQGHNTTLSVAAGGTPTLYYQWQLGGTNVAGRHRQHLFHRQRPDQPGGQLLGHCDQQLWSGDQHGGDVDGPSTPAITGQPQSQSVAVGSNATFTVTRHGRELELSVAL